MTDLEMTKLCAQAMGLKHKVRDGRVWVQNSWSNKSLSGYNPLTSDEQAMALVKNFGMNIYRYSRHRFEGDLHMWQAVVDDVGSDNSDLNRAIVECVAKLQGAAHD